MTDEEFKRMQDYARRIGEADGLVTVLTPEERLDLHRLLLKRLAEIEFGFPVCGED